VLSGPVVPQEHARRNGKQETREYDHAPVRCRDSGLGGCAERHRRIGHGKHCSGIELAQSSATFPAYLQCFVCGIAVVAERRHLRAPRCVERSAQTLAAHDESAAIRCAGLVKRYPDVLAVDRLDLVVHRGECFGLLGPNGAGKTTTIEILEGLLHADAGAVQVLGRDWKLHEHELRSLVGVQLQETRFSEKLTVEETLRLFRSFYADGNAVAALLELVQLTEKRRSWVGKLSGGQRQRLSMACALVGNPQLLFLDEPTTGLDPQSRRSVWDVIADYRAGGKTVLLTTHYMDEAARLCDRVAIMDHGRIIALGTPAALVASLGAEHVVEFTLNEPGTEESITDAAILAPDQFRQLSEVTSVRTAAGRVSLTVRHVHATVPELLALVQARGLTLGSLSTHHATLEDVFVSLTGRQLREE
jgi:ABC-2 type transport system ATP-binding protein